MGRRRRPPTVSGELFKLVMQVAGVIAATIVCGLILGTVVFVFVLRALA